MILALRKVSCNRGNAEKVRGENLRELLVHGNIALNVAGNQPVFFQMFGYLTSAGSYGNALAQGAPIYQSGIITLTPSMYPNPGMLMFGTTVGSTFQGFTFGPVPEPLTIALGVLGAGSLLLLRRKK